MDVLILGEIGMGKEVVVWLFYDGSVWCDKLFVVINCVVLFVDIIESELFGYEIGVFIGVSGIRFGKFEYVDGGIVFFDEVESMLFVV